MLTSTDPAGGAATWTMTQVELPQPPYDPYTPTIVGISCPASRYVWPPPRTPVSSPRPTRPEERPRGSPLSCLALKATQSQVLRF